MQLLLLGYINNQYYYDHICTIEENRINSDGESVRMESPMR